MFLPYFSGKADYQLGRTKVFLKDAQDLFLEQERDRVLTRKILVLQRCIRGWYHRRRFLKMRAAAIVIQKNYRAHFYKRRYQRMKNGYMRLQAVIRSRILSHRYVNNIFCLFYPKVEGWAFEQKNIL